MDPATIALLASAAIGAGSAIFGSKDKMSKVPTLSKEQKQILSRLYQQLNPSSALGQGYESGLGILQQYLNPESELYQNFEEPYRKEFEQSTIPGLAERFGGAYGANSGALSSSGFAQALGSAGANLQTNLAQMKSGRQLEALQSLLGQYNQTATSALNAQPFGYQQKGAGVGMGLAKGLSDNLNMYALLNPLKGSNNNASYQSQYPLTNYYDQLFRTQGF